MKLIEVKTPKAILFLTEDEYLAALKRGGSYAKGLRI